jgi:hypothetical protein
VHYFVREDFHDRVTPWVTVLGRATTLAGCPRKCIGEAPERPSHSDAPAFPPFRLQKPCPRASRRILL